ncbi:lysophospholipid acyltransferase family protein [uncultured Xylophilus sp.]|uniref:lysophospholipid acyltransferase family protein n=1 Tax=uncultured Xylophilus sp. TaxID=296832 RepID=UPI0025EFE173|nr:lysophospholipid acyltransferase family protein [uncultured Xylophilus sp.]
MATGLGRRLSAAWRIVRAVAHGLRGLWILRRRFPRLDRAERQACIERWSREMLALLNIDLRVEGARPADGPLLLVANHTSWLDILAVLGARSVSFVAKSDIRHWPLVGAVAAGAGTLFIERTSRRDALRTVHRMAEGLQSGEVVAIFPEGTTGDGRMLLPFHANLLQAAIAADAPAQPCGIRFEDAATGRPSRVALYVGDDTLLGSLWRTLTADPLRVVVRFGTPAAANGRDRRRWAQDLHTEVDALRQ